MKYILILTLTILSFSFAQAQRGSARISPEDRAKQQTQLMTDSLGLSEAQAAKVAAVNNEYAKKMSAAMEEARGNENYDRTTMRAMMKTMRNEQSEAIKKYLTTEQAEKWVNIQANQRNNRRGKRGKGKKGKRDKKQGTK